MLAENPKKYLKRIDNAFEDCLKNTSKSFAKGKFAKKKVGLKKTNSRKKV